MNRRARHYSITIVIYTVPAYRVICEEVPYRRLGAKETLAHLLVIYNDITQLLLKDSPVAKKHGVSIYSLLVF